MVSLTVSPAVTDVAVQVSVKSPAVEKVTVVLAAVPAEKVAEPSEEVHR
tara:strand:+ start:86 stop:232 length:147 start_codon:yes stop_codon:yes gene_type:complete